MKNIYFVELKKIFSQKKYYMIWGVFIIIMFLVYKINVVDMSHPVSSKIATENKRITVKNSIDIIKKQLANKSASENLKEEYQQYLLMKENQLSNINIVLDKNTDIIKKTEAKICLIESEMKEIELGKLTSPYDEQSYKMDLRYLKYLYENKIPESYGQNSFRFLLNFFGGQLIPILAVLIVLLSTDIVSKEMEDSSIKLILVQPISRFKIITGKYLALISSILFFVLSTLAISFVIVGIKDGFGNPNYPVIHGMQYVSGNIADSLVYVTDSGSYIASLEFLFKLFFFFGIFLITVASISFMISELVSTSTISNSIGIIQFVGLFYIVFITKITGIYSQYIYVTYYNSYKLFTGEIKAMMNNNTINPVTGIVVLIIMIFSSYAISCTHFIKKDI